MRIAISTFLAATFFGLNFSAALESSPRDNIQQIATSSACASLGESPKDYIRGMALVFARAVCHPERPEAQVASSAPNEPITIKNPSDATSVFDSQFRSLRIPNKPDAETMLRHTYTLLTGLGFRETNGRYCKGRYTAQGFSRSYEAEAGLFQASWGAHKFGPSLEKLFRAYQKDESQCLLDVFKDHAICGPKDAKNWNSENSKDPSGVEWQDLTKRCPAFAAEYASVVIREHGGARGEFGPIKCYAGTQPFSCKKAQVYPVCDAMFSRIQEWLKNNPDACQSL